MLPNPKPSSVNEALRALETGINLRKLHCVKYDSCLEQAVTFKWGGFKCTECRIVEEISPDQEVSDMVALMSVLRETFKTGE